MLTMITIQEALKENKRILKENKRLNKALKQSESEKSQLWNEVEQLRKELLKYHNSNTPSSSNKHLKPNTQGKRTGKGGKRGAPKNHPGKTREQHIGHHAEVKATHCPNCDSTNLKVKKKKKRVIEDVPAPVTPETTATTVCVQECCDCGLVFIPPQNTTPLKGKFGINLMILVIFLKFLLRGVLRKTACFLETGFALKITPAAVNAIIKRVAEAAETEYEETKQRIRTALKVYVDETSFSVLGINQWVWVYRTDTDILFVIRPSRGSNVLAEILGEGYSGTVICDCWRAYNFLKNATIQRCWAHLLRKAKELAESVPGRHLYEKLHALFEEIKSFNEGNPTQEKRDLKYTEMTAQLQALIAYYSRYEDLKPVITYIGNALEQWFTCIKIEGIEPTNNLAEQAIRETVMVRKIIGAFRSEKGKHCYETLASLIASWQMTGKDLKAELRRMLVKNLCFC